jgi:hypothetical protein
MGRTPATPQDMARAGTNREVAHRLDKRCEMNFHVHLTPYYLSALTLLLIHPARIVFPYLLRTKTGYLLGQPLREWFVIGKLYRVLASLKKFNRSAFRLEQ